MYFIHCVLFLTIQAVFFSPDSAVYTLYFLSCQYTLCFLFLDNALYKLCFLSFQYTLCFSFQGNTWYLFLFMTIHCIVLCHDNTLYMFQAMQFPLSVICPQAMSIGCTTHMMSTTMHLLPSPCCGPCYNSVSSMSSVSLSNPGTLELCEKH